MYVTKCIQILLDTVPISSMVVIKGYRPKSIVGLYSDEFIA